MQAVLELMRRGWTQERIARAVGVKQATVSYWASGKRNPGGSAVLLLKALLEDVCG